MPVGGRTAGQDSLLFTGFLKLAVALVYSPPIPASTVEAMSRLHPLIGEFMRQAWIIWLAAGILCIVLSFRTDAKARAIGWGASVLPVGIWVSLFTMSAVVSSLRDTLQHNPGFIVVVFGVVVAGATSTRKLGGSAWLGGYLSLFAVSLLFGEEFNRSAWGLSAIYLSIAGITSQLAALDNGTVEDQVREMAP